MTYLRLDNHHHICEKVTRPYLGVGLQLRHLVTMCFLSTSFEDMGMNSIDFLFSTV